jgi:hypothetical protein
MVAWLNISSIPDLSSYIYMTLMLLSLIYASTAYRYTLILLRDT